MPSRHRPPQRPPGGGRRCRDDAQRAPPIAAGPLAWVEVGGVEPPSSEGEPGLLRAQLTRRFSRLLPSRQHVVAKPSSSKVPSRPWNPGGSASLLYEASNRTEGYVRADPSVTAQAARAKSARELSAVIGFPRIVNEMSLDPRPASPGTTVPSRNQSPPVELSSRPDQRPGRACQPINVCPRTKLPTAPRPAPGSANPCHGPHRRHPGW